MRVIVSGCGKIGRAIVESLINEQHQVIIIDNNPEVISSMTNTYDVMAVCGDTTAYDVLMSSNINKADIFIAVTNQDSVNILTCIYAKKLGVKYTVARIRDAENNGENLEFLKNSLDISFIINPDALTAKHLHNLLLLPSATKVETFTQDKFKVLELSVKNNSSLVGKSLIQLRSEIQQTFLVGVLKRGDKTIIPNGLTTIEEDDKVWIICSNDDCQKFLKESGFISRPTKNAILIGASKTSYYLTELLCEDKIGVKIIEIDRNKCEQLTSKLPNSVVVINGNGMNQDLLEEEGLSSTDALVALTGHGEENILMSCYAHSKNVDKVIAKINRIELHSLAKNLGIDSIVCPQKIIADEIVGFARSLESSNSSSVLKLYNLTDGVEVTEFKVLPNFKYKNIPLKDLRFRKDTLIAGVIRGEKTIIVGGNDYLCEGDMVIVFTLGKTLKTLNDIIK